MTQALPFLLDLLFTHRQGQVGDVMVGSCLGLSDAEKTEFSILGEGRSSISKTSTMDFHSTDFGLFRTLVRSVTWESLLKDKGVQEDWTFFKKKVLEVQSQAVPMCSKMNCQG